MPKIIYYRHKCIGCGICYERQPDQWRMSRKDGKANLIRSTVNKEIYCKTSYCSLQQSVFVAKTCPVRAIKVTQ